MYRNETETHMIMQSLLLTQEGAAAKLQRQIDLEATMRGDGMLRYIKQNEEAANSGREADTAYGRKLLKTYIQPVAVAIAAELQAISEGQAGYGNSHLKDVLHIPAEVIAYLSLKGVLNVITSENTLQYVALHIGKLIEDEAKCRHFDALAPDTYNYARKRAQRNTTYVRRSNAIGAMLKHTADGAYEETQPRPELAWEQWTKTKKLQIGTKLINLICNTIDLIAVATTPTKNRKGKQYVIRPTETLKEWLSEYNDALAILSPMHMPCIIPPLPFTHPTNGGYHTTLVPPISLVKTANKGQQTNLKNNVKQMQAVYDAVNTAMAVAWKINKQVFEVAKTLWKNDIAIAGLPSQNNLCLPLCPKCGQPVSFDERHDCFTADKELFKQWKREAALTHSINAKAFSKRILVHRVLWTAEQYKDEDMLYFPYQLDFRGRLYAVPQFLNPQGHDIAKALLTFAEGKAITDDTAEKWLAIQVANTWGEDKSSFGARVEWVKQHEAMIQAIASDPYSNKEWAEADSPFCFLAACYEWAAYRAHGKGYISHLPIAQDGTCSGLQHYSAILRDTVGGAAVNLIPAEKPQDIYAVVAERTIEALGEITPDDDDYCLAQQWLVSGLITRKVTKRAVMTLPYGSTLYSAKKYIRATIEEIREKNPNSVPWLPEDTGVACSYLGKIVWGAIRETVIAAAEAMDWLKAAARLSAKAGMPLTWTSPSGMPIIQEYMDMQSRRVDTALFGGCVFSLGGKKGAIDVSGNKRTRIVLTLQEETDRIDQFAQIAGLAPNFIHSLDASAMMFAVNASRAAGIKAFALIHDSFGTHAADSQQLADILRDEFIRMYETHDVLQELNDTLRALLPAELCDKMPPLPRKGTLDLNLIRVSEYFFA